MCDQEQNINGNDEHFGLRDRILVHPAHRSRLICNGGKMVSNLKELESELSTMIVEVLNLEEVNAASIDPQAPLFDGGLGLDSIDALEIGAAINRKYGIKLKSQDENTRDHFESVSSLAKFIESSSKID